MTPPKLNEERLFTLISRAFLAITLFLLTALWSKVDALDIANKERDKELAQFMLSIEHRLTTLEAHLE